MNDSSKKILAIVALVLVLVGVKYGVQNYRANDETIAATRKAEATIAQIKTDGVAKHPEVSVSEAIQREAIEKTTNNLKTETNKNKRLTDAASNFFGFYLINVRERTKFCKELGVDIAPFSSTFDKSHSNEMAKARAIFGGTDVDEDKLYAVMAPQLRQLIVQDMGDIAAGQNVSVKGACELFVSRGQELASKMHISKIQPAVFEVLNSAQ